MPAGSAAAAAASSKRGAGAKARPRSASAQAQTKRARAKSPGGQASGGPKAFAKRKLTGSSRTKTPERQASVPARREGRAKGVNNRKVLKGRRRRPAASKGRGGKGRDGKGRGDSCQRADSNTERVTEQVTPHTCPICQEAYSAATFPVVHAPCGHVACAHCSLQWQQKKSARTCALCRSPVLSIALCPLLEQLLERQALAADKAEPADAAGPPATQEGQETSRAETKKALRELSQGDLNDVPGDYRGHLVRQIAFRAVRKGDLAMLETCLRRYKARASTKLSCDVAEYWKADPKPALSLLLAHGARLDGHIDDRPLLCAIQRGNSKMVKALLEMKADPHKRTGFDGDTALHVAVRCGRFEEVRLLLDQGVPADIPDRHGRTPLFIAEQGWDKRQCEHCDNSRENCERCESRLQVRGELRWRKNSTASDAPQPPQPSSPTENDAQSDESSSEWEDSESDVSDCCDWLEDEEEESESDGSDAGDWAAEESEDEAL